MAFAARLGSLLRQSITKHGGSKASPSTPSIYHAIRCMSSKLYVGGLSYSIDDHSLREAFTRYGDVTEARVILDRETGNSRGFGFVSFTTEEEASAAIEGMNQTELSGRTIRVNIAQERTYGGGGGGYGGYSGGGRYGGGGGYGGGGYGGGYGGGDGYGGSGGGDSYAGSGSYGGSDGGVDNSGSGSYGGSEGGVDNIGSGSYGDNVDGGGIGSNSHFSNDGGDSSYGSKGNVYDGDSDEQVGNVGKGY